MLINRGISLEFIDSLLTFACKQDLFDIEQFCSFQQGTFSLIIEALQTDSVDDLTTGRQKRATGYCVVTHPVSTSQ